ncbi:MULTISPECIES: ABC transporter ATP-binding protein [Caloramator]|jgi:oligopeptide transport system ATP-binding protein|uniref:Oligopeptide transport ATP-binding protein OppF (TC 3.A.1.5.1) n=1 Tax=Caloramator australicus RC3 TaxID=857293 RepID=G0V4P8_9CLOT|nr:MULTISPECIES: dipeptide ABC transporter ATP-binding protein [Caloramator]MDO6353588.1 dipeptide ABC transporter ATP-binding protein [Caloramator sp. CAR-1]CCC58088.1 Oligopeptide transport ATP-binding protein OppF (TC 3.A.1.5.1) [Caloramator australicus RC3]
MDKLVEVYGLKKYFPMKGGFFNRTVNYLKAVDGVSFFINRGEVLGVVGESGCGKSTTGRTILKLLEPTDGKIVFDGEDITKLEGEALRKKRKEMQLIFQDPYSSLNPRMTVGEIIGEPITIHEKVSRAEKLERVKELLNKVGLSPYHVRRYPHEFSGGQRQRIGIARALALNPKFIVADESVSALDVSIQAQVINLFEELKEEFKLTYMFISHDLSVVRHISDRISVMYLGRMVEMAETEELFNNPMHPYTQALLSAVPIPNPKLKKDRIILQGDVPSPINAPKGCVFHTRCRYAMDVCKHFVPEFKEIEDGHFVSCFLYDK